MNGSPSGRIRIQRRSASAFDGRHSPASSSRVMNISTSSGWRQREKTSTPIFGSTPFSPRSILTAIFSVSRHDARASRSAAVSPCQPIAASPSGIVSQPGNMITRRMTSSSPRLVIVPICLKLAPFGKFSITRSNGARNFFARSSPRNGGRKASQAAAS